MNSSNATATRIDSLIRRRVVDLARHGESLTCPEQKAWLHAYIQDFCNELDTSDEPIAWLRYGG